ncbi:MAG: aspartate aminotransferase family protein [Flavobacteriaceae bacterium]
MKPFDVYPLYEVEPVKAFGTRVLDEKGQEYLDLYGGHGVISIGHSHPHYVSKVEGQLERIGFYSNAIQNPLQKEISDKLGKLSKLESFDLFLCNSGAEANENALKLASFYNGKSKVLAFEKAFHGRTSAGVSVTDNEKIQAPINAHNPVVFSALNDEEKVEEILSKGDVSAVIIEGIQGVGGLDQGTTAFFKYLRKACDAHGVVLILDEIQSGYGRSGEFFAFQHHGIIPDLISVAKGMGNGFPIGGVLISPKIEAKYGMLGTTFGGNHLACAAGIAVLDVIASDSLMENVKEVSEYFLSRAQGISQVKEVKGRGLMLGLEFEFPVGGLRKKLIYDEHIFTGGASNPNLLRILPPLNVSIKEIEMFFIALEKALGTLNIEE